MRCKLYDVSEHTIFLLFLQHHMQGVTKTKKCTYILMSSNLYMLNGRKLATLEHLRETTEEMCGARMVDVCSCLSQQCQLMGNISSTWLNWVKQLLLCTSDAECV